MRIFARVRIASRRGILGDGRLSAVDGRILKQTRRDETRYTGCTLAARVLFIRARKQNDAIVRTVQTVYLSSFIRVARFGAARRALTLARAKVAGEFVNNKHGLQDSMVNGQSVFSSERLFAILCRKVELIRDYKTHACTRERKVQSIVRPQYA